MTLIRNTSGYFRFASTAKGKVAKVYLPLQERVHHLLKSLVAPQQWACDPPLQRLAVFIQAEIQLLLTAHLLLIQNKAEVQ